MPDTGALMADSVTGIILLVLAGFLLLRGGPGLLKLLASRSWAEVPGTIVGSGVQTYLTEAGGGQGRAASQRSVVAYAYEVGGNSYTGERAAFGAPLGFGGGLGGVARAQARQHEPGATVTVWVDPKNPADSVLRRSAPSSVAMVAIGVVVLALGLLNL